MAGIYFHIPYCRKACHYCDFHFSTNFSTKDLVIAAMRQELEQRASYLKGQSVSTIYFGGGTPSVLSAEELLDFIQRCKSLFEVHPDAEITLEINPDDVTESLADAWLAVGVNRVSIGIQSFDDAHLRAMNRSHDGASAIRAMAILKPRFRNITADLMYGLVNDSMGRLMRDVRQLLDFGVPHISTYCLTIEDKTAYGRWSASGKLEVPEDELSVLQYDYLMLELGQHDFKHYEISNFGKEGYFSLHNSNYWKGAHYLGVGPGAHSFNGESRQFNKENNVLYANAVRANEPIAEIEFLDEKTKLNEYVLTRIRTIWGVELDHVERHFPAMLAEFMEPVYKLLKEGLLEKKENCIFLTPKGKHFSDRITRDLFLC